MATSHYLNHSWPSPPTHIYVTSSPWGYCLSLSTWWRHQMETFSALLALCAGNLPVSGEFPAQRPVTRSFDVFFDLLLIKRLSKHSRGSWFQTLSCPLWRHCNVLSIVRLLCYLLVDVSWLQKGMLVFLSKSSLSQFVNFMCLYSCLNLWYVGQKLPRNLWPQMVKVSF